jgi:UDP-3-O-[3-hydroxymyristoyl] glucosamine N-acyltransferase
MVDTRFFSFAGPISFGDLCAAVECALTPDDRRSALMVTGASEPATAQGGELALIANRKYAGEVAKGCPGILVTAAGMEGDLPEGTISLAVEKPHLVFARMLDALYPEPGRSLALAVARGAYSPIVEQDVVIAPGAVFGPDVTVGRGTVIGPGAVIGRGVTIGRDCVIGANVTIECAHLGDRVVLWPGVRVGCEGFGWLDHGVSNRKVPQLGRVIIQDRVEVGANSTIDRGALGDTVVGEATKIDNLVQIGHNCKIGRNCLIAATSGISGSTTIGDGVLMGGGVGTSGHLSIGAGSVVHGRAAVTKDWPAGSKLAGAPAQDIKDFWRELAMLRRLGKGDQS